MEIKNFSHSKEPTNMGSLLIREVGDGMFKPLLVKRAEALLLTNPSINLQHCVDGTNALPEQRLKIWNELQPLEYSIKAGQVVASRILQTDETTQTINNCTDDLRLLDYLSDWGDLMGINSMGNTGDSGNYMHRRARIVGMLKTVEDEYISEKGELQNIEDWKVFYQKLFGFFDVKIGHEMTDEKAEWIKTYSMFYLLAWNYSHISSFEEANLTDQSEVKYRAILEVIYAQEKEKREAIIQQMEKLDKSTKLEIGGEDSYPSYLFRKGLLTIDDQEFRKAHTF